MGVSRDDVLLGIADETEARRELKMAWEYEL